MIAPEQEWPHPDLPFNDTAMPGYDEKIDIWRLPEMLAALLPPPASPLVPPPAEPLLRA